MRNKTHKRQMKKKNILIVFGGSSSEYYVSCLSAAGIVQYADKEKYDIYKLGITMDGEWLLTDATYKEIEDGRSWINCKNNKRAIISPEKNKHAIITIGDDELKELKIDCVFPLIHGYGGEDGKLQGLLELSNIPFVGSSVLASANSMDKGITRIFADICKLKRPKSMVIFKKDNIADFVKEVEASNLDYPLFVKPANAGSSVGVSKVDRHDQLEPAIKDALLYDDKALVEEGIEGKEIKVAILERNKTAVVGELCELTVPKGEINDYDTKYVSHKSNKKIPADIDDNTANTVKKQAIRLFNFMECKGFARVDFFVDDNNNIYFNEINTIPGISKNSIYPLMMEKTGITYSDMISDLIESAFAK